MTNGNNKSAQAGGFLIAVGTLVGAVGGIILGEPSVGFLVGFGVGVVIALLLWWRDRQ